VGGTAAETDRQTLRVVPAEDEAAPVAGAQGAEVVRDLQHLGFGQFAAEAPVVQPLPAGAESLGLGQASCGSER
jgi:hypothetical protein